MQKLRKRHGAEPGGLPDLRDARGRGERVLPELRQSRRTVRCRLRVVRCRLAAEAGSRGQIEDRSGAFGDFLRAAGHPQLLPWLHQKGGHPAACHAPFELDICRSDSHLDLGDRRSRADFPGQNHRCQRHGAFRLGSGRFLPAAKAAGIFLYACGFCQNFHGNSCLFS